MAARLAGLGHRVLVVDRAVFPRDKACSEYLSPAAVDLLDRLGVVTDLVAAGAQPLLGTRVYAPRGAALTGSFTRIPCGTFPREGLAVARRILDARLVQAARDAGAEVREATTVDELLYQNRAVAGAVVSDRRGTRGIIHARIVIGADGLRSVVARRIGRRRHGLPARLAFVAHVAGVAGLDGHAEMHVGPFGYVGLNRIAAGRAETPGLFSAPPDLPACQGVANVALVVPARLAAQARGRVEPFFFEQLEQLPGVAGRVRADRIRREILVTGPFAAWSGRTVVDGALLVGDAADFFDPFTGEGIYSALKGAELAADVVHQALGAAPGIVPAWRLKPYRLARRAAFLGKWTVERLVGYGMLAPALFDRAVRRLESRGLADTFVGVTADMVPARAVLNPWFLARMVL
jgi:flavin-dependent dehydrogenase